MGRSELVFQINECKETSIGKLIHHKEQIYGDTPDDKMGDLADIFTVADQTGSSPDMSQLSGTQVINYRKPFIYPDGSSGFGVIMDLII